MKVRFNAQDNASFFINTRKQVDAYFKENKIGKNANAAMILKSVFFLTSLVVLYYLIVSQTFDLWTTLFLAIAIGMVQAFIGFNVCHDAIHGSYSSSKTVNKLLGYVFNVVGANAYVCDI